MDASTRRPCQAPLILVRLMPSGRHSSLFHAAQRMASADSAIIGKLPSTSTYVLYLFNSVETALASQAVGDWICPKLLQSCQHVIMIVTANNRCR